MVYQLSRPRGLRNNNAGNIRHGDDWIGMSVLQLDPSFVTFKNEKFGIRAMTRILNNYRDKYGLVTVADIISRWAPAVENDTNSYIFQVSKKLNVSPYTMIDTRNSETMQTLIESIIYHENGTQPYSVEVIQEGMSLA